MDVDIVSRGDSGYGGDNFWHGRWTHWGLGFAAGYDSISRNFSIANCFGYRPSSLSLYRTSHFLYVRLVWGNLIKLVVNIK